MRRRSSYERHPQQVGCMLAILVCWAITLAAIAWAYAYLVFSW